MWSLSNWNLTPEICSPESTPGFNFLILFLEKKTSSLSPKLPQSNPAGRSLKKINIWRESQAICTQWRCRIQNSPLSDFTDVLPPPFFPLKTAAAEQNLLSWPFYMSLPSSQIASFYVQCICLFYWHLPLNY